MAKTLVNIYLPVVGKSFDIIVPSQMVLYDALDLINKIAIEISEGIFDPTITTVLSDRESGSILNVNLSVEELCIKNGSKLMLI